jgi:hypothetical protein
MYDDDDTINELTLVTRREHSKKEESHATQRDWKAGMLSNTACMSCY